jgi:hypothetical protein
MASASGSLGDDLEVSILARVPCHKTLVNAMYAKKAWRKWLYSPKFRREFCSLHSEPPLLGCFINDSILARLDGPLLPSFCITRDVDPKINAIVKNGDFFLTKVLNLSSSETVSWNIADCVDGLLLLANSVMWKFVVYNPMTRWSSGVLDLFRDEIVWDDLIATPHVYPPRLVRSDEDPNSFRVVVIASDTGSRVRALVFSSSEMKWSDYPWQEVAPFNFNLKGPDLGSIGNKFLYWGYRDSSYLLALEKASLKFSNIELPGELRPAASDEASADYCFGEAGGGKPCVVATRGLIFQVFKRASGLDGVERWVLEETIDLTDGLKELLLVEISVAGHLRFHGIIHETLFFDALYPGGYTVPHWFLSLRLDTTQMLEKLFSGTLHTAKYPYFIGWPSSNIDG